MEFINQKWLLRSQNIMLSAYQKSKVGVGNVPLPRTQLGCLTLRLALASKAVHSRTAAWWLLSLQTEENYEHATCCLYVHMFLCMCVCTCMCVHMTVCVHMHACMCADCDSVPQLLESRVPELSCLFLSHPLWSTNRSCSLPFLLYLEPEHIPSPPLLPRWLCLCRDKCLLLSGLLIFALADCFQYKTRVVLKTEDRAITPQTHSGTPLLVSCLTRWQCGHCHSSPPLPGIVSLFPTPTWDLRVASLLPAKAQVPAQVWVRTQHSGRIHRNEEDGEAIAYSVR